MEKSKVLVALSGGVDSSLAAILLKEQGYELVGVTLNIYDYGFLRSSSLAEGIKDAQVLANKLGIPYYVIDVKTDFEKIVIKDFIDEYSGGKTPNPCVLCNYSIKWNKLIEIADEFGCQFIATGHYAQINTLNGRYFITEAIDESKDQSFFLWRLNQYFLSRTIFPLGDHLKSNVKKVAASYGLDVIAKKKESYNVCFIPDNNYRDYISSKIKKEPGLIRNEKGEILLQHKGVWNYTIGQRVKLEYDNEIKWHVKSINPEKSEIVVSEYSNLFTKNVKLSGINLLKYDHIPLGVKLKAKINYRSKPIDCAVTLLDSQIKLDFKEPIYAIAPGQSIVLFEGNDLVAGGKIL